MALSVEDYFHTAISFTYISVSDCDVTCFETETILWNPNLCETTRYISNVTNTFLFSFS